MMKIQVVSDLHLEFSDVDICNINLADVLVLSGDIMLAEKVLKPESELGLRFRNFLERCSKRFAHVVYVAGNHEFFGGYWTKSLDKLREACALHDNVYFLERDMKIIDDVVFVGCTLWTDMNKGDPLTLHAVRDMINDYRAINNDVKGYTKLKPTDTVARHRQTVDYIKQIVSMHRDKKVVVVGHHTPSFQSCHKMYSGDHLMNGAYHSSLEYIMLDNENIVLWTHGHTHNCFDYMVGQCRVVCNPRGYVQPSGWNEYTGWDDEMVIEI